MTECATGHPSFLAPARLSCAMTSEEREYMDRLGERIQVKKNPKLFTMLVDELNQFLERTHQRIESTKPKAVVD
jgi:hypothetical protein